MAKYREIDQQEDGKRSRLFQILKILAIVFLAIVIVITVVLMAMFIPGKNKPTVDKIADRISDKKIKENSKFLSETAHPAGSENDNKLATEIMNRWEDYGLKVFNNTYEIYLPTPTENSYIKTSSWEYILNTEEDSNVIPPFNAFSKNGKASGLLVFVNYGTVEDFADLKRISGLDLTGKVALCRYGKIFRGSKVENAHKFGMSAMILYSDPEDKGKGEGFPDGMWMSESSVERGNVKTVKGDLYTHLYPAYKGGYKASKEEYNEIAPKLPVLPIPYNKAKSLISLLDESTTQLWGNRNVGPSKTTVEVNVDNENKLSECRNILGVIEGKEEPDKWVIIGAHRDAWIYGAADPGSGMSIIMELARSFGEEYKKDWKPRRTIIFASWDAEEPGIIGSYEFVEDYSATLNHKAVAYLNLDTAVSIPQFLKMKATPNFNSILYEQSKLVDSPDGDYKNLYDFWIKTVNKYANSSYSKPPVIPIGSGSDYTAFLNEIGVSSVDFAFGSDIGLYPVYHTQHDTFEWMEKFGDPKFKYHRQLAKFAARVLFSLSSDSVLKLSLNDYITKILKLIDDLKNEIVKSEMDIDLTDMEDLCMQLDSVVLGHTKVKEDYLKSDVNEENILSLINEKEAFIDRQFIYGHGLPGRKSFRHLVFAPSSTNTYAGSLFPGVVDAIVANEEELAKKQFGLLLSKLDAARSFIMLNNKNDFL